MTTETRSPLSRLPHRASAPRAFGALLVGSLALAGCAQTSTTGPSAVSAGADGSQVVGVPADEGVGTGEKEVATLDPRVLISHEGGLLLLDGESGEVLKETEHEAFLRLNNAGDGRHVMVSDSGVFRVYDTGIESQAHGDHAHNFEFTPGLTGTTYEAEKAGHVVVHDGRTALFADGTGQIQTLDSEDVADPEAMIRRYETDDPHHGVAFELTDGSLFTTQGTEEARSVVQVRRGDEILAETTDCPGSHGEATAQPTEAGDVVVIGCQNGPVVYRDGAFHKVPVQDAYSRSGNIFGSHESPIVLGDYKVDEDAELERPTRIALIDTHASTLRLVDLGSAYWFRSFARGPQGEALVLTYDGTLHVLDPATGGHLAQVPVITPWQEKDDWQEPGPAVKVAGDTAYITDAEERTLHTVDLGSRTLTNSFELPVTPVEIAVTTGEAEAPAADDAGHDDTGAEGTDEHEGHDH